MIISGGSRCNWRFFSKHLMKSQDNERVTVAEIRGLAAQDVREALREMDFVAGGTRCKNFFYHANINPREDETLTAEQWEQAVDTLERNLRLEGHARFIVEHEKDGRIHRHVIWNRINPETMTAVSDSFTARDHERTSRELEQAFGLEPVESVLEKGRRGERERNSKNWETFRGNASGFDPREVKAEVTELWNGADSGKAFAASLEERGYILCQGDRRDFCIVDPAGDEHSLARRIAGAKAADIRARMVDIDRTSLPTVTQGRELAEQRREAWQTDRQQAAERETAASDTDANRTEREGEKTAPSPTEWENRKREARDAIAAAEPFARQIREEGQTRHEGMGGLSWWQRAVEFGRGIFHNAREWVHDTWTSFVESRRTEQPERDGPDLER